MIPFRDNIPSRTFPIVTISLIALNALSFFHELSLGPDLDAFIEEYALVPARLAIGPLFTSMFLHGGWMHLIGNMWYLWIFGDNVEDRLGHVRYLLFYLLCGVGAGLAQTALSPNSEIPTIGASGAVAGVLGAYIVSYPFARVQTLIFLFIFIQVIEIPALVLLGLWFVLQFLSGTASLAVAGSAEQGGVAWWAHVGGFLLGIALLQAMRPRPRQSPYLP